MKKYLWILLVVSGLLIFAGCSSSSTDTAQSIEGSWGLSQEYGPVTTESGQEVNGTVGLEYDFKDDGTYTLSATNEVVSTGDAAQIDEVELEGSYKVDGNEVTMTPENIVKNEVTQLSDIASADGLSDEQETLFDQFEDANDLIGESETHEFDIAEDVLTISYDDASLSFQKN